MVKTPRMRHSKSGKQPVTIDLEPEAKIRDSDMKDNKAAPETPVAGAQAASSAKSEQIASADKDRKARSEHKDDRAQSAVEAGSGDRVGKNGSEKLREGNSGRRRSSFSAIVIAGVIGGVIALAGWAALQQSGVLGASGNDEARSMVERLNSELADLRREMESRLQQAGDGAGERVETLSARVDGLQEEIAVLRDAIEQGGAGEVAALEALQERLDTLEERIAGLGSTPPEGAEAGLPGDAEQRLSEIESAVGSLEDAVKSATSAASENAAAIKTLETEMEKLSQQVDAQAEQPEIALAIAAAALKSAIDRGLPFMVELETYASIAPDSPEIKALRDMAASGVPTRAQIQTEVPDAIARINAAANPSDPDAGFFERMMDSLQSLIQVRPIGMVEGESPAAITARMQVAINANDFARAIEEFESLPEALQAPAEDFIARVRARMEADALVDKALANALRQSG